MNNSKEKREKSITEQKFETDDNLVGFFYLLLKIYIKIIKETNLKNKKENKFSMDNPIVFIITMLILYYLLKQLGF